MTRVPSILVVTVVHDPEDSRIRYRQIPALLADGWRVTYAAPFTAYDRPQPLLPGLRTMDLPRALGRDRLAADRAARALIAAQGGEHDLVLVHDPEIVAAVTGLRLRNLVWDVHEDPAAALVAKDWLPRPAKGVIGRLWRGTERLTERRHRLLLAEYAYQERFAREHAVVPNAVTVPATIEPPGTERVVYLGTVTMARGTGVMVEAARRIAAATEGSCRLEVIGGARDDASRDLLEAGQRDGVLTWHGFVPAAEALAMLPGALAGLSLLQNLPNYRHSRPTKIVEYLAHGVPVVTTPLPVAVDLVESANAGIVVPFDDPVAAADAILALRADPKRAATMGRAGHEAARAAYDWSVQGGHFTETLRGFLAAP
ncbi:MAG: glycosyltransferase [Actinobacteria bacterium]|nr:glycosyltransferase [Actinomycetota bacterium]